jgi:hypothetical protein
MARLYQVMVRSEMRDRWIPFGAADVDRGAALDRKNVLDEAGFLTQLRRVINPADQAALTTATNPRGWQHV